MDQARRSRPDIIILNMNMLDQSGLTTLHQLRAVSATASIPVIFLTATAQSAFDRKHSEELGAFVGRGTVASGGSIPRGWSRLHRAKPLS